MLTKKNQKTREILLLSGTPASGKDEVSAALLKLNSNFEYFKKHCGSEVAKKDGKYIYVRTKEFNDLVKNGSFIQYHGRYERLYGVSLKELEKHWKINKIPIIHNGKLENIEDFIRANITIKSVLLITDKKETVRRLNIRHIGDKTEVNKRLIAYREDREEMSRKRWINFDLTINNSKISPQQVAKEIISLYRF